MKLLHESKQCSQYSRVELYDKEHRMAPETPIGKSDDALRAFFDRYGVVASCKPDVGVSVKVYQGNGLLPESSMNFVKSGTIEIGNEGLYVGDSISADSLHSLRWSPGSTIVSVYSDTTVPWEARTVVFVLL